MRYANITSIPSSYIVAFFSSLGDASPPGELAFVAHFSSVRQIVSTFCWVKKNLFTHLPLKLSCLVFEEKGTIFLYVYDINRLLKYVSQHVLLKMR